MSVSSIAPEGISGDVWDRIPKVEGDLAKDAVALLTSLQDSYGEALEVRLGELWERKGYPQGGSLSRAIDPSPYRNYDGEVVIALSVVVPIEWLNKDHVAALKDLTSAVESDHAEKELAKHLRTLEAAKSAARAAEAAALTAQAEVERLTASLQETER